MHGGRAAGKAPNVGKALGVSGKVGKKTALLLVSHTYPNVIHFPTLHQLYILNPNYPASLPCTLNPTLLHTRKLKAVVYKTFLTHITQCSIYGAVVKLAAESLISTKFHLRYAPWRL